MRNFWKHRSRGIFWRTTPSTLTHQPVREFAHMHHCTALQLHFYVQGKVCMNAPFTSTSALLTLSTSYSACCTTYPSAIHCSHWSSRPDARYLLLRLIILPRSVFFFSPAHLYLAVHNCTICSVSTNHLTYAQVQLSRVSGLTGLL